MKGARGAAAALAVALCASFGTVDAAHAQTDPNPSEDAAAQAPATPSAPVTVGPADPATPDSRATAKRSAKTKLKITITGVVAGATPRVTITGPKKSKFKKVISETTTFKRLLPGTYRVSPATIDAPGGREDAPSVKVKVRNKKTSKTTVTYSFTRTVAVPPTAPRDIQTTFRHNSVDLTWQTPADNGGTAITDYIVEYSNDGGTTWETFTDGVSPATSTTVTGLTDGVDYVFRVIAVNGVGNGATPEPTAPVTPAPTAPDAPTDVAGTSGNEQVSVGWTEPNANGQPIDNYTVTATPGGQTCTTAGAGNTTCTVTSLTNGTSYTFKVTAANSVGTSAASAASTAVVPATVPNPPATITSAVAGNAQVVLSWPATLDNGGNAVTGYTVEWSDDNFANVTGSTTTSGVGSRTATVTGLTNYQAYKFRVFASNDVGISTTASALTEPITPQAVAPGAPTEVYGDFGNTEAHVYWTAPASDGGDPSTLHYELDVAAGPGFNSWDTVDDNISATDKIVTTLTNGTAYKFRVRAETRGGISSSATSADSTVPATVPDAPTNVVGTLGNGQVLLTWTAPTGTVATGGSELTDFNIEFSSNPTDDNSWVAFDNGTSTDNTDVAVSPLVNYTEYKFRVKAKNKAGYSAAWSTLSAGVTPEADPPSAPTNVSVTPRNGKAIVVWSAPAQDNGAVIDHYFVEYTSTPNDPDSWITADQTATSPYTVTGLTNETTYSFRVLANNRAGDGAASGAETATPTSVTPDPPTVTGATPGDQQVALAWNAPGDNGGSAILDYTIEWSTDNFTSVLGSTTSATSPKAITGLSNDVDYKFRVKARNVQGLSDPSSAYGPVRTRGVPDAPDTVAATPADQSINLTWVKPADNGAAIDGYVIKYSADENADISSWMAGPTPGADDLTATITGLTNGTPYFVKIFARNVAGDSPAGAPSGPATPRTVPDAPAQPTVVRGNESVVVTWTPLTTNDQNNGDAVDNYKIEWSTDGFTNTTGSAEATTSPFDVTGLTNGTPYTFRVSAHNAAGYGAASTASEPATPARAPDAPVITTETPDNGQVTLGWTAPSSNGEALTAYVIKYTDTPSNGIESWSTLGSAPDANATSAVITGLTNGTAYTFKIFANNAVGASDAATSNAITPLTLPDPPAAPTVVRGDESVSVSWSLVTAAPANGGNPVTGYTIEWSDNNFSGDIADGSTTSETSPATVTGLTNGTAYKFRIRSTNTAGTGAASSPSAPATPARAPDAPSIGTETPGNTELTVQWTAPSGNGEALTGYIVKYTDAPEQSVEDWSVLNPAPDANATSATVTGLTNGTTYTVKVYAVNAVGTGAAATSSTITPRTTPSAPAQPTGSSDAGAVRLSWISPDNGGDVVTEYKIERSTDAGSTWGGTETTADTTKTISGLTNGTAYIFRVSAKNAAGYGSPSSPTANVTPMSAPAKLSTPTTSSRDQGVYVTWTAPDSNNIAETGGSAITKYYVQWRLGETDWSTSIDVGLVTAYNVSGLTNNENYTFRVIAENSANTVNTPNTSVPSEPSASIRPAGLPDAPSSTTGVDLSPGFHKVIVNWAAPSNNGSSIVDYQVRYAHSDPAGIGFDPDNHWVYYDDAETDNAADTTITVSGKDGSNVWLLENSGDYYFEVRARNQSYFDGGTSNSWGAWSDPMGPVTPTAKIPEAPTDVEAVRSDASVRLTWTTAEDNGSPLSDYAIRYKVVGTDVWIPLVHEASTATEIRVNGLLNGSTYTFEVAAINEKGTGAYAASRTNATPATTPQPPTAVTGVRGPGEVVLSWTEPNAVGTGGAAIIDYPIEYSSDGGTTWTAFIAEASNDASRTVTGLTNGVGYKFRVYSKNTAENSLSVASASSATVTPARAADQPTAVVGTRYNSSVGLTWAAPASNGGSAIINYKIYRTTDTEITDNTVWTLVTRNASTNLFATVAGLTNGTAYKFRVAAVNTANPATSETLSDPSPVSDAVTPATIPQAPASVSTVKGNTKVDLTWTDPSSDGGDPISDYIVEYRDTSISNGQWTAVVHTASTEKAITVSNLTNFHSYSFRVAAVNSVGQSEAYRAPAANVTPNPYVVPEAPTDVIVTDEEPQSNKVPIAWDAPAVDGGTAITSYTIQASWDPNFIADIVTATTSGDETYKLVTGLTNNRAYRFRVAAVNSEGTGPYSDISVQSMMPSDPVARPSQVTGLSVTPGDAQVSLTWNASSVPNGGSPIQGYHIWQSVNGNDFLPFSGADGATDSATPSHVIAGLTNGSVYRFKVRAYTVNSYGPYSSTSFSYVPNAALVSPLTCANTPLVPDAYLANCDLRSRDLENKDLSRANLTGAIMSSKYMRNTLFTGAKLAYAQVSNSNPHYADFSGADLTGAEFSNSNMTGVTLNSGTNTTGTALSGTTLSYSNLSGTDFGGETLTGSNLTEANLTGANFSGARLNSATLWGATFDDARFNSADLRSVNIERANLKNAVFTGANLSSAYLWGATITADTVLTGATMTGIRLEFANLTGANLENASMAGANLSNSTTVNANLKGATINNANLTYANLTGSELDRAKLASSNLTGAVLATAETSLVAADLSGATLSNADLTGTNFGQANLTSANLTSATLDSVTTLSGATMTSVYAVSTSFVDVDLAGVALNSATLISANFSGADLTGTNLSNANLNTATLIGATLTNTTNMNSASLVGNDLTNMTLRGVNLNNANLTSAILVGADLYEAQMTAVTLANANLTDADLSYAAINWPGSPWWGGWANLSGANLTGANLSHANLIHASLTGATLSNTTNLSDANLDQVNFGGADLTGVTFTGASLNSANLDQVNLTGADLRNTTLSGGYLRYARLTATTQLSGASIISVSAQYSLLNGVDFAGVNLSGSNFGSADLSGANLSGANLTSASLDSTNLSEATLDASTTMTGAYLPNSTWTDATLESVNLSGRNLQGANLADVNLQTTTLTSAYLVGANLSGAVLSGAAINSADFSWSNMSAADLVGVNAASAKFTGANLKDAQFDNANLSSTTYFNYANVSGADFSGADLTSANLDHVTMSSTTEVDHTVLTSATLTYANLTNVNFADSYLNSANLASAWLGGVTFTATTDLTSANLSAADLTGATITGAKFTSTNLTSADLTGKNLTTVEFTNANLTSAALVGVVLTNHTLVNTNFTNAVLTNASLSGFTLTKTDGNATMAGAILRGANLTSANLTSVSLSAANLRGTQFDNANLTSAVLSNTFFNSTTDLTGATLTGVTSGGIVGTTTLLPAGWSMSGGNLVAPVVL